MRSKYTEIKLKTSTTSHWHFHCVKNYRALCFQSHTNSIQRVNPVTYTLFKHTSSDGLSGLCDFPDGLKNISKTEKYKWVTAMPAWSTLLLMSSQYCSRSKNLGQRCDMFCNDTPGFIYFFGIQKPPAIQQAFTYIVV